MENITDEKKTTIVSPVSTQNIKQNPYTTYPGITLLLLGVIMYVMEFIVAPFLPKEISVQFNYEWYKPLIPFGVGLLLIFMNDQYFGRLFNMSGKVVEKVTHTESKD